MAVKGKVVNSALSTGESLSVVTNTLHPNLILLSSTDPTGVQLRSFMNTALYRICSLMPFSLCLFVSTCATSAGKYLNYKALTMLL